MQIKSVDGFIARCEARGIERDVNLFMLPQGEAGPGDHVVVHVGYAIQKITEHQARSAWELYDQMLGGVDASPAGEADDRA
jgi:hydrogenase expression/formation protein HypC